MSKAVKAAGLGLVIFITVWVVTLWQWYRSQQPVSGEEVATQLVLLPVGLSVVAVLAWWCAGRLRDWSTRPVDVAPAPAGGAERAVGEPPGGESASEALPLGLVSILAESIALPHADESEQAWSTLRSGQLRPGLDPVLQDGDGLPVFSSRAPGLSTEDWLDAHAEVTEPTLSHGLLRAMALIEGPLHRLLSALPALDGVVEPDRGGVHASGPGAPASASSASAVVPGPACLSGVGQAGAGDRAARRLDHATALDVLVWVPAEWPQGHRAMYMDWLRQHAGVALDWTRASGMREPRWLEAPLEAPEDGWVHLQSLLREIHRDERPRLLLVLAAHSLVDEACVAGLQARGELFTAQHQGGRVPGEGAAGLLLANASMTRLCSLVQHPWLGAPVQARRQRSADRAGRPGADELTFAMQQALEPWVRWPRSQAVAGGWWCVSDADHRPSRSSELFEAFQSLQPGADAMASVLRLGDAWGDLGIARALVPVALASSAVRQGLQPDDAVAPDPVPALVGLLQGSLRRWAIPVWPSAVGQAAPPETGRANALAMPPSSTAAAPEAEPLAA